MGSVRVVAHEWVPLSDGCRLSARLWLPEEVAVGLAPPVPAVLEYLPYRKDDLTAWQDSTRHPYFAEHGYASVRVDLRGTGDSDGILCDEYLAQEQADALEVIEWLAEQPWCSGEVGMIGYSWGGFNGLQVAARRPPRLKAVVSLYSTDDRYRDDCHYLGGALLAGDMLRWAETMRAINALPPNPAVLGEDWRAAWLERLERTPNFAEAWLSHQTRDEYWKHGSIAEDYSAIEAATLIVGGWADAYTNPVTRMLENLTCPRSAIIGPWAHVFPERGIPGPAIGFLQECVAWFDRWLKGRPNDVEGWPSLRVWLQEPVAPAQSYAERPGRWLAFEEWPPPESTCMRLWLDGDERLMPETAATVVAEADQALEIESVQSVGEAGGVWCANGLPEELAGDQRVDDARSLTFDSEPFERRVELLGRPAVTLHLEADRPRANVVVRLCDVAPSGESTLLSYGVLNLAQRESDESPRAVEPDRRYSVRILLNAVGAAVEHGHQLRLAISPTCWPLVWPPPEPVLLRVMPGGSCLELPRLPMTAVAARPFAEPEHAKPLAVDDGIEERERHVHRVREHSVTRERELHQARLPELGVRYRLDHESHWHIADEDPLAARFECTRDYLLERDGHGSVRVVCSAEMRGDSEAFRVREDLRAFEAEVLVFERERSFAVPRGLL